MGISQPHIHKQTRMQYPQLAIGMWVVVVCEQHNTLKSKLLLPTAHRAKHTFLDKHQHVSSSALNRHASHIIDAFL